MNPVKIDTPSCSADAAVEWVAGPGRKPKLEPHELTALSEADREKIRQLILLRQAIPDGPNKRREQIRIGNQIHALRHPGKYSNTAPSLRAKAKWLENNREKRKQVAMDWYRRNYMPAPARTLSQSKIAVRTRQRRKDNIQFAIADRLRATMNRALRRQYAKKSKRSFELLGCTPEFLRAYLTSLFLPGMSWEKRQLFHVDHRRPLASFDLRDPEQQNEAFHYTNLQPLWALDNRKKSDKW